MCFHKKTKIAEIECRLAGVELNLQVTRILLMQNLRDQISTLEAKNEKMIETGS